MFSSERSFSTPTTKVFPLECFAIYGISLINNFIHNYIVANNFWLALEWYTTCYG